MKILKFMVFILTMLIINSCGKGKDENIDEEIPTATEETDSIGYDRGMPYPFYKHLLFINFQDASGNDLVKGSEFIWNSELGMRDTVKPKFYTLDIIFEDGIPNPWKPEPAPMVDVGNGTQVPLYILDVQYPRLYLAKTITPLKSVEKALWFETSSYRDISVPEALLYEESLLAEKIIFRLTCPYIFNDNKAHDIVTWWKLDTDENGELISLYAKCYCVEYGGKEFPVSEESIATIILDR